MWDNWEITRFWNSFSLARTSGIKRFELDCADDADAKAEASASELKRFELEDDEVEGWGCDVGKGVDVLGAAAACVAAGVGGFGASKFCKAFKKSFRI